MEEAVASAYLARRGNTKPVMLAWENHVGEPMVFVDSKLSELSILAPVIAKNMPKDAVILSWWDTSRQIQLLTGLETVFTSHLSEPLITPSSGGREPRPSRNTNVTSGALRQAKKRSENFNVLLMPYWQSQQRVQRSCVN